MKIKFIGRRYEIPETLKKRVERRVSKLQKLLGEVLNVEVVCSLEKYRHTAEVMVKGGIFEFRAKETTNNMLTSLNSAFDIVENQVKRGKDKRRDKKKAKLTETRSQSESIAPRIRYSKDYSDKPLTLEEAIIELESLKKDVLVYRTPSDNKINVVYKKGDVYFLVEPEW